MQNYSARQFKYFSIFILSMWVLPSAQGIEKIIDSDGGLIGVDTSADGRYVVYAGSPKSNSTSLQVYLLDRTTGETILVSRNSRGEEGDRTSRDPMITPDGHYIVFSSIADNLIDNDQNPYVDKPAAGQDIFGYDVLTGEIELLSKSSLGVQSIGVSYSPEVSDDGNYVLFLSRAANLVADDMNGEISDAFVHDRTTGNTVLVNRTASGVQSNSAGQASLSGDGKKVAFSNGQLLHNDSLEPAGSSQVFLKDWQTGEIELISRTPKGFPLSPSANGFGSGHPSLSRTGDIIAYTTNSLEFINGSSDREDYVRLVVFDRTSNESTLISEGITEHSLGDVRESVISKDGRYIAFTTSLTNIPYVDQRIPQKPRAFLYDREQRTIVKADKEGFDDLQFNRDIYITVTDDGREILFRSSFYYTPTSPGIALFGFMNPAAPRKISIEKTINGESSITGGADPLANLLAGRPYRADYTVTNTLPTRIYSVKVFDDDQGSNQLACNLYALAPGQSTQCYRFYQAQAGANAVPARVEAKISGEGTIISSTTPQVSYVGQDTLSGGLTVKHALNNKPGDNESSAVMVATNTDQSWLFKVTNTSNIDVYKVKVYNDGVFPLNTGWEELCLIGKLKIGETRYCKRPMAAGQTGLNLMMGLAQANDAYVVGSHQYINAANPTYYTRTL